MIYIDFKEEKLSRITFGGASLSGEGGGYGFGAMNEAEAQNIIHKALDVGINLFDTAPIYGFGLSEERLGRYLPKEALVISKSGVDWHPSQRVNMSNDPLITERMLNESLKRLNRECIDIYMIHWPDPKVDITVPLSVLKKAQVEGKIRYLGLCNTNAQDFRKAQKISSIDFLQSEVNLFHQTSFEDLGDLTQQFTMGWGTFDKGILSGRVTAQRKFDPEDARSWAPWWNKKLVQQKILKTAILRDILSEYGFSLGEFCLHFSLTYKDNQSCLIGMKSVNDVVEVTSNLRVTLMRERIEEVIERWNKRSME